MALIELNSCLVAPCSWCNASLHSIPGTADRASAGSAARIKICLSPRAACGVRAGRAKSEFARALRSMPGDLVLLQRRRKPRAGRRRIDRMQRVQRRRVPFSHNRRVPPSSKRSSSSESLPRMADSRSARRQPVRVHGTKYRLVSGDNGRGRRNLSDSWHSRLAGIRTHRQERAGNTLGSNPGHSRRCRTPKLARNTCGYESRPAVGAAAYALAVVALLRHDFCAGDLDGRGCYAGITLAIGGAAGGIPRRVLIGR
jgi:hypothetical protein